MRMKCKYATWIVMGLFAIILCGAGPCVSLSERKRTCDECVSSELVASPLRDLEHEMSLAALSGKDLEYWIDGEKETAGCHWHLTHVECQKDGCLYRCRETEALWHLSKQSNSSLKMEKLGDSTLPKIYVFSSLSVYEN